MQQIVNLILDEVRGSWRFRRWALAIAWLVCLLGWLFVLTLPSKYEAIARVFVDPSTALKPVIQGLAIEQDVNAELNLVREAILSEPQLRTVIEQTHMDVRAVTPAEKALLVKELKKRIEIAVQGDGSDQGGGGMSKVYVIRYRDNTRERSLEVVRILLKNFMEQTLGGKRTNAETAQKFLEAQIQDYEKRLGEAEQRLADFKKRHMGLVPGENQGDYFTRLQTEMDAVKSAQTTLNLAATRRDALQKQLRGEAPLAAAAGVSFAPNSGGVPNDTLSQIKATQAKLDDLLLRFTDKHPDVLATRETLQDLKVRRASELEALKRGDPNAAALTGASSNPVYQGIQQALYQTEIEVAAARGALVDHQSRVAELRRMAETMPQVEAEHARLNRDYTVTKTQYTSLVERLEKARLGEEAEATGSIRFEVIDPPMADYKPASPKRSLLLAGVLLGGLGLGAGVAYLLNKLRPVFNDMRSLAEATGLTVLGAISLSRTDAASVALQRSYARYYAALGALAAVFVIAVLVGRYLSPLQGLLGGQP